MQVLYIHDAKTHLSELIRRALAGEEIVIVKAGDPMVTLVPYQAKAEKRKGGQWRGRVLSGYHCIILRHSGRYWV